MLQITEALKYSRSYTSKVKYLFGAPHIVLGGESKFPPYGVGMIPVKSS